MAASIAGIQGAIFSMFWFWSNPKVFILRYSFVIIIRFCPRVLHEIRILLLDILLQKVYETHYQYSHRFCHCVTYPGKRFPFCWGPPESPSRTPGIPESHFEYHCAYRFDIRMLLVLNIDFMAPKSQRLKLSARSRLQISVLVCFSHCYFGLRQAACQWLTAQRWRISPPHSHMGSVSQHSYFHKAFIYRRWWMGSFFQEMELGSSAWWGGKKTPETSVGNISLWQWIQLLLQ